MRHFFWVEGCTQLDLSVEGQKLSPESPFPSSHPTLFALDEAWETRGFS